MSTQWKNKYIGLFIVGVLCWNNVNGQSTLVEAFIKTAFVHPEVVADSMILRQLNEEKFRSPWIREIDVRLRANELSPAINEFRMRFDLMNPTVISADKNYQKSLENYRRVRADLQLNQVLKDRYQIMLLQMQYTRQIELLEDYLSKLEAIVGQLPRQTTKEAIALDEAIFDLSKDRNELQMKVQAVSNVIENLLPNQPNKINWQQVRMQDFQTIKRETEVLLQLPLIDEAMYQARLRSDEDAYQRELAQNKRNLGFIQPEYELKPDNSIQENLGFQVGVVLPIFREDRVEEKLDQLEMKEKQAEIDEEKSKLYLLVERMRLMNVYYYQNGIDLSQKSQQLYDWSQTISSTEIDEVMDILKYQFKVNSLRLKNDFDMMELYVQSLSLTGILAQPPFQMYLFQ